MSGIPWMSRVYVPELSICYPYPDANVAPALMPVPEVPLSRGGRP